MRISVHTAHIHGHAHMYKIVSYLICVYIVCHALNYYQCDYMHTHSMYCFGESTCMWLLTACALWSNYGL